MDKKLREDLIQAFLDLEKQEALEELDADQLERLDLEGAAGQVRMVIMVKMIPFDKEVLLHDYCVALDDNCGDDLRMLDSISTVAAECARNAAHELFSYFLENEGVDTSDLKDKKDRNERQDHDDECDQPPG